MNITKAIQMFTKAAESSIHVEVKTLPYTIIAALKSIGYNRRDIEIFIAEKVSPHCVSGDGCRGIFCTVDIDSGETRATRGSWGGANPFETKLVDHVEEDVPIPYNCAVIKGTEGNHTYVKLYLNPKNAVPLLEASPDDVVSLEEAQCLYAFKGLKPAYRKGMYTEEALEKLIEKGCIKRTKVGTQITTAGRNAFIAYCKAKNKSELSMP